MPTPMVECGCPRARHKHGTREMYNADRCRCDLCRAAKIAGQRADRQRAAQLRWTAGRDTLRRDATGTRRRLQSLRAIGWSQLTLARELGVSRRAIVFLMTYQHVSDRTADRVAAVYNRCWDQPQRGAGADMARAYARAQGWLPPLAWDDDTIDDPDARPQHGPPRGDITEIDEVAVTEAIAGRRVHVSPAERKEAVRRLTALGLSATEIAERLDIERRSVGRLRSEAAA